MTTNSLSQLTTQLNGIGEKGLNIKITWSAGTTTEFLDVYVSNENGQLKTSVYHKPVAEPYILLFLSEQLRHVHRNAIKDALFRQHQALSLLPDRSVDQIVYEQLHKKTLVLLSRREQQRDELITDYDTNEQQQIDQSKYWRNKNTAVQYTFQSGPLLTLKDKLNNLWKKTLCLVIVALNNNIMLFKGYGNGTFSLNQISSTGDNSCSRAIGFGYFNSNDLVDISVVNYGTNTLGVFVDSTYIGGERQSTYSTGSSSHPRDIFKDIFNWNWFFSPIGDVNNDNKQDIVIVNSGSNDVLTFLKYDLIVFHKQISYSTGKTSSPNSISIADFNNDHQLDSVVANQNSNNIGVFLGLVDGLFSNQTIYSTTLRAYPKSVNTADINKDQNMDVIVTCLWSSKIAVLLGFGNGTLSNQIYFSFPTDAGPTETAVGEFNNDGHLDIVVTLQFAREIAVLQGYSNGSFSPVTNYYLGIDSYPNALSIADLNNDSFLDIVIASNSEGRLYIFQGYGDGTFVDGITLSTGLNLLPRSLLIADLNKDKFWDIAVANSGSDNIQIFFGDVDGSFSDETILSTGSDSTPYAISISNFNNEKQLDIAVLNYGSNTLGILFGCNDKRFFDQITYSTGDFSQPYDIAIGDLNNDQYLDVLIVNLGTDNVGSFLGYAIEDFISVPSDSIGSSISQLTSLASGDWNNETKVDVVVTDNSTNTIKILFGSRYGTFSDETIYSTGNNSHPTSVVVSDLNNDHFLDIIETNSGTNNIGIFFGNANGTFQNQLTHFTGVDSQPNSVVILDFNNDTYLDIAVTNYGYTTIL
ncbi:unnamed protein product [Adineta ricciae]|uniref:Uncharacterized protein n=1 Tax=Adineta ricciae TaxID=249248 RepID=A0A815RBQ4_ADIRI|nr:unnamed protein product [Adineta ricciae]CAF1474981.1 unnamed protein product [Adineta ricciae]